ncbi:MAG: ABC transporter ATP-binding protein [Candidatus Magasanikbacteria bacterium]|nr:ABC transporter ATP-binding protein [Candidatus Magasanikbacteria bacterium]
MSNPKTHILSTLAKYWQEARRNKKAGSFMLLGSILATLMGVIMPLYYKQFFDILASPESESIIVQKLFYILVILALFEAGRWVFWRLAFFCANEFFSRSMANLTNTCYRYLHRHSFKFFNNNFVGSLVKRVNYFTRAFENICDRVTWDLVPLLVEMLFVMVVLWRLNFYLGLAAAVWVVVFISFNWIFSTYKIKFDLKRSAAETKSTAHLADTITNNSNVKLFVGYRREVSAFSELIDIVRKLRKFTWNLDNIFESIQAALSATIDILLLYIAIRLWQKGLVTIGDFVLIQSYVMIIVGRVWSFGRLIRHVYTDLADAAEMTQILDTPHEIVDSAMAKKLEVNKGEIKFKEVDFYYHETRKIFSRFNLSVKPHEKIALVGPSGAGKSTVVKLLLRQHDIAGGTITIDGQRIDQVTQESLWLSVSLVPQDPILFHRSLLENIRYGKSEASDEEVVVAAKLAHCDEFISGFPEGYKTFVGERGVKLSGGERQRVAIARAILRNTPILILDEATSSLDSESESLIQDALNTLMKNKTVLVVAHRLSTIMKMDRIIVVNNGIVIEEGTHAELLKKEKSLYGDLWRRQAGGFLVDGATP